MCDLTMARKAKDANTSPARFGGQYRNSASYRLGGHRVGCKPRRLSGVEYLDRSGQLQTGARGRLQGTLSPSKPWRSRRRCCRPPASCSPRRSRRKPCNSYDWTASRNCRFPPRHSSPAKPLLGFSICSTSYNPPPASNAPGWNDSPLHTGHDRIAPRHSPRS
jgi:hypothetical protein